MTARKKRTSKKVAPKQVQEPAFEFDREVLVLGHLIKYNLYLLSKTVMFNSLLSNLEITPEEAADQTNRLINELDLDAKQRIENQ